MGEKGYKLSGKWVVVIIVSLLVIDQLVKILVKSNMTYGQSITVFPDWFFIRFIENPGAAFGLQLGGEYGKLALTLLRIGAVGLFIWILRLLMKKGATTGVLVGFSLLIAGAIGNILDSMFYGLIFSESTATTIATLFPAGGGYGSFLHGKVVDMLFFPLFSGTYPSWLPWFGGNSFTFFSPIFNFADSYITIGALYMLIFQQKFFKRVSAKSE